MNHAGDAACYFPWHGLFVLLLCAPPAPAAGDTQYRIGVSECLVYMLMHDGV